MGMRVPTRFGLALGLLFVWGCGAPEPSVSGTVRLDGQPLLSGSIDLIPEKGTPGPSAGAVIEKGQYSITKGVTLGKYKVAIHSTRRIPNRKQSDTLGGWTDAEEAIKFEKFDPICDVRPGRNTCDFELREVRKRP
jgi:hypothetical protein